jgi:hypothetical protein
MTDDNNVSHTNQNKNQYIYRDMNPNYNSLSHNNVTLQQQYGNYNLNMDYTNQKQYLSKNHYVYQNQLSDSNYNKIDSNNNNSYNFDIEKQNYQMFDNKSEPLFYFSSENEPTFSSTNMIQQSEFGNTQYRYSKNHHHQLQQQPSIPNETQFLPQSQPLSGQHSHNYQTSFQNFTTPQQKSQENANYEPYHKIQQQDQIQLQYQQYSLENESISCINNSFSKINKPPTNNQFKPVSKDYVASASKLHKRNESNFNNQQFYANYLTDQLTNNYHSNPSQQTKSHLLSYFSNDQLYSNTKASSSSSSILFNQNVFDTQPRLSNASLRNASNASSNQETKTIQCFSGFDSNISGVKNLNLENLPIFVDQSSEHPITNDALNDISNSKHSQNLNFLTTAANSNVDSYSNFNYHNYFDNDSNGVLNNNLTQSHIQSNDLPQTQNNANPQAENVCFDLKHLNQNHSLNLSNFMYTPEMFHTTNYEFNIIKNLDVLPLEANDALIIYDNNYINDHISKTKIDLDLANKSFDIRNITSKLNSSQLQKFADIKYNAFIKTINTFNLSEVEALYGMNTRNLIKYKNNLFKDWNTTKSSIKLSYCECKNYITLRENNLPCPFENKPLIIDGSNNNNNFQVQFKHKPISFSIELFNNYVLSILLNKKLRTYLKKTIRPPKNINEEAKYLNLVHDGNIYRDAIKNDIGKIDFAFTFTLVTPSKANIGIKGNSNLGCVYFILNELPDHLKYRFEFMFLACVCDINDKQEWNQHLLTPLLAYLNYLNDNIVRVSLNRHEYYVKIVMIMALGNYQCDNTGLLDMSTSSFKYQCAYCTVPRCIVKNEAGFENKPIYNSKRYPKIEIWDYLNLKKNSLLPNDNISDYWSLRKPYILESIPYFNINRCLIFDIQLCILKGVFKNGVIKLINNHFRMNASEYAFEVFNSSLSNIQTNIEEHNIFKDQNVLFQLTEPTNQEEQNKFGTSISDLKILQSIFPYLFHIYYDDMFENDTLLKHQMPSKFKVLALLLELNGYINALFCSEVERKKVPDLRNGFFDLIAEIEHLSKFTMFNNLNILLMLPLHYMSHLFDKWEDIGDLNVSSVLEMDDTINAFTELMKHRSTDLSDISETIKCMNLQNCMKIYNFKVSEYPLFKFLKSNAIDKTQISIKAMTKFKEFNKKFLFDIVSEETFNQNSSINNIEMFELNSIIIKPEDQSTALNLVRIKNTKRSLGWKYVHIYGVKEIIYTDSFTKETSRGVFIEYKETKTKKRFQKTSDKRPAFSLGEFLTLKSSNKEVRCAWLDDIQMVALRVLNESHWIYDPLMLFERAFDI